MKNLYAALAGLVLLASTIQYINYSNDSLESSEFLTRKKEMVSGNSLDSRQLPFAPLKRNKTTVPFLPPAITATNTYVITNNAGPAGASAGDELEYTVNIVNNGTDATGVSFTDQIDANTTLVAGSIKTSSIAQDDSYTTIGNVGLNVPASSGLLANDINPGSATLSISGTATRTTTQSGSVTLNLTTGAFTYTPAPGFTGTDTFTYLLENGSGTVSSATVTISLSNVIWFINDDADAATANGTLAKPFKTIAAFQAINNNGAANTNAKTGHSIFIYGGTYTGPLTLLASQKVIGEGSSETVAAITGSAVPSGSAILPATNVSLKPSITTTSTNTNGITIGTNNTVKGISVGATTGSKIEGNVSGTFTAKDVELSGAGRALNLSGGTLDASFSSLSSTTSNLSAVNVSGSVGMLSVANGVISSTGATAINISGSSNTSRLGLNFAVLSVTSNGAAKGIAISNTSGTFTINGSGSAGSGGTISSISQRGLEFVNAAGITIKGLNLTSANTSEGTVPINRDNSGSNGAVYANNVDGLTLNQVVISGTVVQQGINLLGVNNLVISNSSVASAGTVNAAEEGCIYAINTSGTSSISSSTFSNAAGRVAYFANTSKDLTLLTIDGSTFQNSPNNSGLTFEGYDDAQMGLKILNSSKFLNCQTDGVEVYANGSADLKADIRNSTMGNGTIIGKGIDIAAFGAGTVRFNVVGNTAFGNGGTVINMAALTNGYLEGTVFNNTVKKTLGGGSGIVFSSEGPTARGVVKIDGNNVLNQANDNGISVNSISANATRSDVTISNNIVSVTNSELGLYNIDVVAPALSTPSVNRAKICANVTGNNASQNIGVLFRARSATASGTEILLQGNSNSTSGIWGANANQPGYNGSNIAQSGSGTFTFGQTCATPNVPALRIAASEEIARKNDIGATVTDSVKIEAAEIAEAENRIEAKSKVEEIHKTARVDAPLAGETVTVNGTGSGFTLPSGRTVTIKFKVLVNAGITACQISNQGTVSGSGFANVLTDDPTVSGTSNPTIAAVTSAPSITCPANLSISPDAGTCTASRSLAAIIVGCPAPTVTYRVGGNVITFPYAFPTGLTTVEVTAANGVGANAVCSFTVTVNPSAPVFSQEPLSKGVCADASTTLTVQTLATNVTYQWQKKPAGGAFANISVGQNASAASATLSLNNIPLSDDKSEYRCIVTNSCANSTTSAAAVLTVSKIATSTLTGTASTPQGSAALPVLFTATGGVLPYTFSYRINNGAVLTTQSSGGQSSVSVLQSAASEGTFNYVLVSVSDNLSCSLLPASLQSATITVTPPLPVKLVEFAASKLEKTVYLEWKTAAEINSEKFNIERSQDGKNWQLIGSKESMGESTALVKYSYTDNDPIAGENLYRLKMIDKDQTFAYSRIVSIRFDEKVNSVLYPNPVADQLNLKNTELSKVKTVKMHNLQGALVYYAEATSSGIIPVKDLPAGMYIVSVLYKDGNVETHKVIVNR